MVAGCLAGCGYYMGPQLHRATEGNPKGYFESRPINRINDAIIRGAVATRPPIVGRWTHPKRLGRTHMWLAQLPVEGLDLKCGNDQLEKMKSLIEHQPFAFKDSRFSYTLPLWQPVLGDAALVCVFRHPIATARSLLKETSRPRYAGLELDERIALDIYACMYEHILTVHRHRGDCWRVGTTSLSPRRQSSTTIIDSPRARTCGWGIARGWARRGSGTSTARTLVATLFWPPWPSSPCR